MSRWDSSPGGSPGSAVLGPGLACYGVVQPVLSTPPRLSTRRWGTGTPDHRPRVTKGAGRVAPSVLRRPWSRPRPTVRMQVCSHGLCGGPQALYLDATRFLSRPRGDEQRVQERPQCRLFAATPSDGLAAHDVRSHGPERG